MADSHRAVFDSLRRIVRSLRVSSRSSEKACGLSSAQIFVLRATENETGISINELAERTLTHQSSVSVVVTKLAEQGLVEKKASAADSRRTEVWITRQGRSALRDAPASVQSALLQALNRMGREKANQLGTLLSELVQEAGLDQGSAPLFFEEEPPKGKRTS